jgi:type III secretory pathway lipoprotein EscJ
MMWSRFFWVGFVMAMGTLSGCTWVESLLKPCSSFAERSRIQQVLNEQASMVRKIEGVHPGQVRVIVRDVERCPGKAMLEIGHATEKDRQKIERMVGRSFYGLSYRMINW